MAVFRATMVAKSQFQDRKARRAWTGRATLMIPTILKGQDKQHGNTIKFGVCVAGPQGLHIAGLKMITVDPALNVVFSSSRPARPARLACMRVKFRDESKAVPDSCHT